MNLISQFKKLHLIHLELALLFLMLLSLPSLEAPKNIFLVLFVVTATIRQVKTKSLMIYLWMGSMSAWLVTFGIGFFNTTFHHEHGILACLFLGLHLTFLNTHRIKLERKP